MLYEVITSFHCKLFPAFEGCCVFLEPEGNLNFRRAAACNELFVFDCNSYYTEGVFKSAVDAVNHVFGAAAQQNGNSLRVVAACDKGRITSYNVCYTKLLRKAMESSGLTVNF